MHTTKYIRQDLRYREFPIPVEYWEIAHSEEVMWKYRKVDFYHQHVQKTHHLFQHGLVGNGDVSPYG